LNRFYAFLLLTLAQAETSENALVIIKDALNAISSAIVGLAVSGVEAIFGITIPPIVFHLIAIGMIMFFFWKWVKRLPLLIAILMGIVLVAFLVGAFSSI